MCTEETEKTPKNVEAAAEEEADSEKTSTGRKAKTSDREPNDEPEHKTAGLIEVNSPKGKTSNELLAGCVSPGKKAGDITIAEI